MKHLLAWVPISLSVLCGVSAYAANDAALSPIVPLKQEAQAAKLASAFLTRYQVAPVPLDAAMSEKIFDRYLKDLDPERSIFLQSDIEQFSAIRDRLGEAIQKEDLALPYAMFNLYRQRSSDCYHYARDLLKHIPDFKTQETISVDRSKASWFASEADSRDWWRKRIKNDWLRLRLANYSDNEIAQRLNARYDYLLDRLGKLGSGDVIQLFLNDYVTAADPHSSYSSPKAITNFNSGVTEAGLVGIGATLKTENGIAALADIVPGGSLAESGKLQVGDRIVGVSQGSGKPMVDVYGMALPDIVYLLRGKPGSPVQLDVIPLQENARGNRLTVALVRKEVRPESLGAKGSVMSVSRNGSMRRVGVITVPTLYQDFAARMRHDADFKSVTRDVTTIVNQWKGEGIDAILLDLRNNGGGALDEAISLTGLFINKGPVVQQRTAQSKVRIDMSDATSPLWAGPVGVLINRHTASGAEIIAAAIQDYGRGVVIGDTSYGMGTIQTIISLDKVAHNETSQIGDLKMSISQFFRINGGSTQLRGVTPDITLPSVADGDLQGETSYDNALPWSEIAPAEYRRMDTVGALLSKLQSQHDARTKADPQFQALAATPAAKNDQATQRLLTLNEAERRKDQLAREGKTKAQQELNVVDARQVELQEAVNIVGDELELMRADGKAK